MIQLGGKCFTVFSLSLGCPRNSLGLLECVKIKYFVMYLVIKQGFGLVIGFIEIMRTVNTVNNRAMVNSCILQFTTALTLFSLLCLRRCLITALNAVDSSASVFDSSDRCLLATLSHRISWPQILAIFCLVSGHHWLPFAVTGLHSLPSLNSSVSGCAIPAFNRHVTL
jgi:hypothetical protein